MVIKWKNILNRGNKTDRAPAPAACRRGAACGRRRGLTAFLLGISLLLAGGLGQYGWWSTELGAGGPGTAWRRTGRTPPPSELSSATGWTPVSPRGPGSTPPEATTGRSSWMAWRGTRTCSTPWRGGAVSCTPTPRTAASSPPASRRRGTASRCAVRTEWCPLPRTAGNWMYMGTAGTPRTTCGRPRL